MADTGKKLYNAAEEGDFDKVKQIATRENVNWRNKKDGQTALWISALRGDVNIMDHLYSLGADLNVAAKNSGWTPLLVAVFNGETESVRKLIELGADLTLKYTDGGPHGVKTALEWAQEWTRTGTSNGELPCLLDIVRMLEEANISREGPKRSRDEAESDPPTAGKKSKDGGGALLGKTIVFTGTLAMPRKKMTEKAEAAGAKVAGSVSKSTHILVAGPGAGAKAEKAKSLGVEVWTEEQFTAALV